MPVLSPVRKHLLARAGLQPHVAVLPAVPQGRQRLAKVLSKGGLCALRGGEQGLVRLGRDCLIGLWKVMHPEGEAPVPSEDAMQEIRAKLRDSQTKLVGATLVAATGAAAPAQP